MKTPIVTLNGVSKSFGEVQAVVNLSTVVFPEPEGPSIEKNSPGLISKSRLTTA